MQTLADKNIVVVIPVYNGVGVLREVIESLIDLPVHEIVIVDDGSDVKVFEMISDLHVHYIRHRTNLGQGAAIQTGFRYAKRLQPEIVITFDADGQHKAADVLPLIDPIVKNEADITIGSRFLVPAKNTIPTSKWIILQFARLVNFFLSGMMLSDAHNGLRALNSSALAKISLTENRMAHASEFLFEIKKHKLRLKEVPVQILYTTYSKETGQSAWDSIKILFDLVLHKLFK